MILVHPEIQLIPKSKIMAEVCRQSYYEFLKYFWGCVIDDDFQDNWHIEFICNELQAVAERVFKNEPKEYDLIINVPPGTSKTTICTIMFPAWCWVRRPSLRFITGSYSKELATKHSTKSRDLLKHSLFEETYPGLIKFKRDMDGKTAYANVNMGEREVTSIGGTVTGKHAHIIGVDDPINPEMAYSEPEKKTANRWMDKTMSSRKVDKKVTPTILIMQRLAEDDPTGHLLAKVGKSVRHICLPAELTDLDNVRPKEAEKFYKDGLLDPVRLPRSVLDEAKVDLGSADYAGQFLQNPSAAEGNIFKREWWKYYKELPAHRPLRIVQSWDTAFKGKTVNDYNVCTTWHVHPHGYFLVDFWMEKVDYPTLKKQAKLFNSQHGPHCVLIEDKANGTPLGQELKKDTTIPVIMIEPVGDKIMRAHSVMPTLEAGNVYLPEDKPYTAMIVEHSAAFPGVKNDDIEDSITQFLNWIRSQGATAPPVSSKARPKSSKSTEGF